MVWVNKRERTNRRKLQQLDLTAATTAITLRAMAIDRALRTLLHTPDGAAHLQRLGWAPHPTGCVPRTAAYGTAEGTVLLQGVVLARWVDRLLRDAAFVQWATLEQPIALAWLRDDGTTGLVGFDLDTGLTPGCFGDGDRERAW
jgi:hypothetical protein